VRLDHLEVPSTGLVAPLSLKSRKTKISGKDPRLAFQESLAFGSTATPFNVPAHCVSAVLPIG
jgi:hypothetical protein